MDSNEGNGQNRSAPELIRVGCVSGAHGLRGAIRLRLDNPDSALIRRVSRLTLERAGRTERYQVVKAQSAGRGNLKITLSGITRPEQASALRGAIAMVEVSVLPATNAREFYYFEALGCRVVTTVGLAVGVIEEVFSNGANDVWVVRHDSTERLIPVIEDIVKDVDFAARRIIIEAVPGLLD
jgi:16S rRNA processing protein RimM